jgi:hypothetical protein
MRISEKDPDRHASIEYPMEVGAPAFAPIAIKEEKDKALNVARMYAKQEYERIMEQVEVLVKQAKALRSRLDATELVHAASVTFVPIHGETYHLYYSEVKQKNVLIKINPIDWCIGAIPEHLRYITSVKKLGDNTWEEIIKEE